MKILSKYPDRVPVILERLETHGEAKQQFIELADNK